MRFIQLFSKWTISINHFTKFFDNIFKKSCKNLTNVFFSIAASRHIDYVIFTIFRSSKNKFFKKIVHWPQKITESILIAHWDIFSPNPVNVMKNSCSLLFLNIVTSHPQEINDIGNISQLLEVFHQQELKQKKVSEDTHLKCNAM